MDKMKFLIDTDIGDDIDDAFALLLAMKLNLDIVGITTVFKNTIERAKITKKILKSYGNGYENVPVLAGHSVPLAKKDEPLDHLCQYTSDIESSEFYPDVTDSDKTVDFIIDACKKYGKKLTILAIGPFTNLAKIIEKDKNILNEINSVVIMGGAYYKQYADWNVICDVEAAEIAFDNIRNIKCIGADVTHLLKISDSADEKILNYKGDNTGEYISELYSAWKKCNNDALAVLHDPLAVYYAFDNSVCQTEQAPIKVCVDGYSRGLTLNTLAYGKMKYNSTFNSAVLNTHTIAKEVDKTKIITEFMKCFE